MLVIYTILSSIFLVAIATVLYQKSTNAICTSKKRLEGKMAIVTGGTSGIGLEIAVDFAKRGARVIVASPVIDEGNEAKKLIAEKSGNEEVIFKHLDLSSIDSIRKFVADINETEKRLDLLINNAGVGAVDNFLTKDGMSLIMQVNYFGHFLLTLLLLPLLKKTATVFEPSRIVNTSSMLHKFGRVNFGKLNSLKCDYFYHPYSNSKLCLILFAHKLAKKLRGTNVVINCVDPGVVGTPLYNYFGNIGGRVVIFLVNMFFKTPLLGAQTTINTALDKEAGTVSGQYFENCKLRKAKATACNDADADRLWEVSLKLVLLDNDTVNRLIN